MADDWERLRVEMVALNERFAALQAEAMPRDAGAALATWAQAHPDELAWVRPSAEGTPRVTAMPRQRLLEADMVQVARMLAALAAPPRLIVLRQLLLSEQTTGQLAEAARLGAGPLSFHLRTLALAALIEQRGRGRYAITPRGRDALYAALLLSPDL